MQRVVKRFAEEWKTGDRAKAKMQAQAYVNSHRAELVPILGGKTIPELVAMINGYRAAGREEDRIVADMWLLSEHPPQRISGEMRIGGQAIAEAVRIVKEDSNGAQL